MLPWLCFSWRTRPPTCCGRPGWSTSTPSWSRGSLTPGSGLTRGSSSSPSTRELTFRRIFWTVMSQCVRLRKVKMDQRKLMDNANTITDMAKVTNWVILGKWDGVLSDSATLLCMICPTIIPHNWPEFFWVVLGIIWVSGWWEMRWGGGALNIK